MLYNLLKQFNESIIIKFFPDEDIIIFELFDGDAQIIITKKGEIYAEKLEGHYNSKDLTKITELMELLEKNLKIFC
ncbi:MAG: hypothetical protein N2167_11770 [Flavobacteriales bacterium]|nr:hypothetical protein [Flavobacteriales bacterium]